MLCLPDPVFVSLTASYAVLQTQRHSVDQLPLAVADQEHLQCIYM